LIYRAIEEATPFTGEIEVDASYFGGRRKGKRGRGAAGKVPVFGLLKRGVKVYAVVIADAKAATLLPILKNRIVSYSIVYSDSLPSYKALDVAGFRHLRINHSKLFADGKKPYQRHREFLEPGQAPICANLTVFPKHISRYS
jgi:transposase